MKMVERKKTVTDFVYVADDGTEFRNPIDCRSYEENVKRKSMNKIVDELPHFSLRPDFVGTDEYSDYEWYRVKNKEEVDAIIATKFCRDAIATDFECTQFPTWVLCCIDENDYGWMVEEKVYIKSLEDSIAHFKAAKENMEGL